MTVKTISVDSDVVCDYRTDYRSKSGMSTACIKFFTATHRPVYVWHWSSAGLSADDRAVMEAYGEVGPANAKLAKEFAPKIRKGWPDW